MSTPAASNLLNPANGETFSERGSAAMKTMRAVVLLTIVSAMPASAQVTVDVAQITCEQFLLFKVTDPKNITIWLSGYFRGKLGGGTVLKVQDFKDNYDKLQDACRVPKNYKLPVMQVLETDLIKAGK
jgi:hypothetical protein